MPSNVCAVIVAPCRGEPGPTWFGRDLAGKPQLAWPLEAARAVRGVSQVVVFTDEPALREVAQRACVSACLCDLDGAQTPRQIVERLQKELPDAAFDAVLVLDASYPLLTADELARLLSRLSTSDAASVFAATRLSGWLAPVGGAGAHTQAEQGRATWLHASGAAHAFRTADGGPSPGSASLLEEVAAESCLSVRTSLELRLAEVVLRARLEQEHTQILPSNLEAVIFDFDGVMTDNAVWVEESGRESVRCDRGDGMGIGMLKAAGVKLLILSKEQNPVVSARAKKLKLECLQGIDNKLDELKEWLSRNSVARERALYIGNDVNDLECMRYVGVAVCPRDAHETARQAAKLCLTRDGGHGAVRELCDRILERLASRKDFG